LTTVLRFLRHTSVVAGYPDLAALQARCEARPAFQRALAAQMANFEKFGPEFEKPKAP
jgi:glutathione S-transferase